ncbi:hypothetical protein C9439_03010 [archaeon SCG-AAA382B04]|nr:hypothetical protein C9439_03010 [archaeon SCG-AAA382B04]
MNKDLSRLVEDTDLSKKHCVLAFVGWYERVGIYKLRMEYSNHFGRIRDSCNPVAYYLTKLVRSGDVERLEEGIYRLKKHGWEKLCYLYYVKEVLPRSVWESVFWNPGRFMSIKGKEVDEKKYREHK